MRTFILTYARHVPIEDEKKTIEEPKLLREICEFLIAEGADSISQPFDSTIIFSSNNQYIYKHWEEVLSEFSIRLKIYFVVCEVYRGASMHLRILQSEGRDNSKLQKVIEELIKLRKKSPTLRLKVDQ